MDLNAFRCVTCGSLSVFSHRYDGSTVPRLEKLLDLLSSKCPAQEKEALHTAYRDEDGPKVLKRILEFPKAEADRISLLLVLNKIFNAVAVQTAEKVSQVPRTGDIAGDPLEKPKEWPKHRDGNVYIPYNISIAFGFSDKRAIEQAFQEFRNKTCIRFTPRTQENNYINFQALDGNWSFLGKKEGAQSLSLEPGKVDRGTVLHELMHALGFQHEHCRSDRDKYIKINEDNVEEGEQRQFQLLDTADCELPYDYISITHYGRDAFSGDGISPTIIPIPETTTVGQRECLSPLDVVKIRKMYKTMAEGDISKAVAEVRTSLFLVFSGRINKGVHDYMCSETQSL
ncbi:hatching enzyme 1.2-like [Lampetra planeri]